MARRTKRQIIELVSRKAHLPKGATEEVINLFLDEIGRVLSKGEEVILSGFGRFYVHNMGKKTVQIPKTDKMISIPAHRTAKFTTGDKLRRQVMK